MDHLPRVENPYKEIYVPFYGGEYDGQGIGGFCSRRGFPQPQYWTDEFLASALQDYDRSHSFATFLQAYLYFGPLEEFLHVSDPVKQFTRTDRDGQCWIDSSQLSRCCHAYLSELSSELPLTSLQDRLRRYESDLTYIVLHCEDPLKRMPGRFFGLALSIMLLLDCICALHKEVYEKYIGQGGWVSRFHAMADDAPLAQDRCRPLRERVSFLCRDSGSYFLHMLGPPSADPSHESCIERSCTAYNTSHGLLPKHIETCAQNHPQKTSRGFLHDQNDVSICPQVGSDMQVIGNILETGTFPLLCVKPTERGIQLEIAPWQPGTPYVALSHV